MMDGVSVSSRFDQFLTQSVVAAAGGATLITAAYFAIYHFGEQLTGVVPAALLKAAPFLPPQTWALGIAVTAVVLAVFYIAYSIRAQMRISENLRSLTEVERGLIAENEYLQHLYEQWGSSVHYVKVAEEDQGDYILKTVRVVYSGSREGYLSGEATSGKSVVTYLVKKEESSANLGRPRLQIEGELSGGGDSNVRIEEIE